MTDIVSTTIVAILTGVVWVACCFRSLKRDPVLLPAPAEKRQRSRSMA